MKTKPIKIAGMDKLEHIFVWVIVLGLMSYVLVRTAFGIPNQPIGTVFEVCGGLFLAGLFLSGFIAMTSFLSGGVLYFDGKVFFMGRVGSEDRFRPSEIAKLKRSHWRKPPTKVIELKDGRTFSFSLPFWLLSVGGKEDFIQKVGNRFKKENASVLLHDEKFENE